MLPTLFLDCFQLLPLLLHQRLLPVQLFSLESQSSPLSLQLILLYFDDLHGLFELSQILPPIRTNIPRLYLPLQSCLLLQSGPELQFERVHLSRQLIDYCSQIVVFIGEGDAAFEQLDICGFVIVQS